MKCGQSRLAAAPSPPYPVGLAVAVFVDSFVDGFLVGLSSASGASAGVVMAVALTIEMGFLSLTFATTVKSQPKVAALASMLFAPCMLLVGGACGAAASSALQHEPYLHVGLVSFGVAALLYLVTEELLLEAHEAQGAEEHIWWVDLMFFVGFLGSFMMEKFT